MDTEFFFLRGMASRLGVTKQRLRAEADCGRVPCLLAGNRYLFSPDAIVRVLSNLRIRAEERGSPMSDSALTVADVSDRYSVDQHTVLAWIRSGELRAVNVGRRPGSRKPRWRISVEALAAFERSRTASPPMPIVKHRKSSADVIAFY